MEFPYFPDLGLCRGRGRCKIVLNDENREKKLDPPRLVGFIEYQHCQNYYKMIISKMFDRSKNVTITKPFFD